MTSKNKDAKKTGTTAKYVRPAGYFKRYEEKRRKDGKRCRLGIRNLKGILSSLVAAGHAPSPPIRGRLP